MGTSPTIRMTDAPEIVQEVHRQIMSTIMNITGHDAIKRLQIESFMTRMREITKQLLKEKHGFGPLTEVTIKQAKGDSNLIETQGLNGRQYPRGSTAAFTNVAIKQAKHYGKMLETQGLNGIKYPLGSTEAFIDAYVGIAREKLGLPEPAAGIGF